MFYTSKGLARNYTIFFLLVVVLLALSTFLLAIHLTSMCLMRTYRKLLECTKRARWPCSLHVIDEPGRNAALAIYEHLYLYARTSGTRGSEAPKGVRRDRSNHALATLFLYNATITATITTTAPTITATAINNWYARVVDGMVSNRDRVVTWSIIPFLRSLFSSCDVIGEERKGKRN